MHTRQIERELAMTEAAGGIHRYQAEIPDALRDELEASGYVRPVDA